MLGVLVVLLVVLTITLLNGVVVKFAMRTMNNTFASVNDEMGPDIAAPKTPLRSGGPQSLVFNPVFALWGLLDPAPAMRTFDLCVFAHSLVGGISIAIIGWRARWPIPANVLAAALFMFGGASSGRLQHTGIIIIYAVFPLAFLLLQLALQRRSLLLAAGFAIIAADVGLGRNRVALLVCALLPAAAVAEILVSAQPLSYLRERSGVLATSSPAVAKDRQAASVPGARATNGAPSRRLQHRPDMAAASGRTSGHSDASVAGEQSLARQRQRRVLGKPTWRCLIRLSLSSAWLAPQSWEPQQRPHPWHRCAGGGAVHSIELGSQHW